ncbi:bifunctional 5,10-methylenetetrahydrofolate dehydrogenase/5,10-methenyltetrahydrofolate cyclohydrolase [Vibrio crassostreae]|uniref:bifunctional 5,10-methylenetetrahydrofolate dehydrogenase/5,10-methenyltetrahydrofolate cyclohydrolase n=1 Tax=Vibrio crassostreae TaxID=246167 RepID=UPI001B31605E|nr:bifunctional 5,10-methylenetetrahydrofolate dehydrogenase/5,10-methenyltetrahydrofolate cyclohydrolase [Vibrio crassostreae]
MKEVIQNIFETKMDTIVSAIENSSVKPQLTIVTVGEDPASKIYVRNKKEKLTAAGVTVEHLEFEQATQSELDEIATNTNNPILFQLPLPKGLKAPDLPLAKDVDGFGSEALGKIALGESPILPCTVQAVFDIIDHQLGKDSYAGLKVAVIGRSNIVGKPLCLELINRQCTLISMNSKTKLNEFNLDDYDVVVVATGMHGTLKKSMFKSETLVVDVGINRVEGKVVGDVKHDDCESPAFITPVPNGVGRLTVLNVLSNVMKLQNLG